MKMKMLSVEPILFVSYFSGINGNCPAEWADDKVDSLHKLGKKIIFVSGVSSRRDRTPNVVHYRVPSLSFTDLRTEWAELKSSGQAVPFSIYLMLPLALTFGFLLDLFQKCLTRGIGGGKWSWFIPAFASSLYACFRHRCTSIFTTGGPASAHLVGVAVGLLCRRKVISELQDPMSGHDIGRNSRSAKLLSMVEAMICHGADKIVYVTQQAAEEARKRFHGCRIEHIYPGAKRFQEVDNYIPRSMGGKLRLVHLGTLYSTRNMNTLIEAIDLLIKRHQIQETEIEVDNLGEIYGEIKAAHLAKPYVKQYPIRPRVSALVAAKQYDASLLIQHTDERSKLTMPYKTYDYLNIGNPILALTNNPELNKMMSSLSHYAVDVADIEAIATTLLRLIRDKADPQKGVKKGGVDPVEQCAHLLKL